MLVDLSKIHHGRTGNVLGGVLAALAGTKMTEPAPLPARDRDQISGQGRANDLHPALDVLVLDRNVPINL